MERYKTHPLSKGFRTMTDEERERVTASIRERGLHNPITLIDVDGEKQILDGVHRESICAELGIEPSYVMYEGDDPEGFVKDQNEARRHLTHAELSFKAAKTVTAVQGEGGPGRQKAKPPTGGFAPDPKPVTVKQAAEDHSVSERSVSRINRGIEVLGEERVGELVSQGESVNAIEKLAKVQEAVAKKKKKKNPTAVATGDDEWYTPEVVIDVVRATMGGIDLDPASNPVANAVVKASEIFTQADDGLAQEWRGRVFLNPPYSGKATKAHWIDKLAQDYQAGHIEQACLVCPIDFSPRWGDAIREFATAICPSVGNYKFWKGNDENAKPQGVGSMLVYFGDDCDAFETACLDHGIGQPAFYRERRA